MENRIEAVADQITSLVMESIRTSLKQAQGGGGKPSDYVRASLGTYLKALPEFQPNPFSKHWDPETLLCGGCGWCLDCLLRERSDDAAR